MAPGTLVGPLINGRAHAAMHAALEASVEQGGTLVAGGGRESGSDAWRGYIRPATNTIN
ncbi:hypothetical protein AB0K16_49145 [Nonomuraea jabiensis]|uniref:hypothetical protein n=1 Tax=Nonomuraea jabiensis TaxID=882448 RepID=UPI003428FFDF